VFNRGSISCPVFLGRTLSLTETAFLTDDVLQPGTLSQTAYIEFTDVPRAIGAQEYAFESAPGVAVAGGSPVGGSSRGIESYFTSTSSAALSTFDSFYVLYINVAHRETYTTVNGAVTAVSNADATASVVLQDSALNVLDYRQTVSVTSSASSGPFVEVFFTNLAVTLSAVRQADGFGNSAFNGSLGASTAHIDTVTFTPQPNHYYIVALTTNNDPTHYLVQEFDVTPSSSLVAGTQEQEIIDLVQSSQSGVTAVQGVTTTFLSQAQPSFSGVQLLQLAQQGTTATGQTITGCTSVGAVGTGVNTNTLLIPAGNFTGVTVAAQPASCLTSGVTLASNLAIGASSVSTCGRQVTIFYGRPYSVQVPTCTGAFVNGAPTCTAGSTTQEILVGDLNFVGNSFALSNGQIQSVGAQFPITPAAFPQPLTITVSACSCAAAVVVSTCSASCGESQILTSLTTLSSAISGSSGSVSGLAGSLNAVLVKLANINSTLVSVKNLDNDIKHLIKKKC